MYQAQSRPFCASLVRTSNWLAALACAGCATVLAGNISTDFNSGQPPGTSLYGTAYVDFFGGVGDSGTLKLTDAIGGSEGSFIVDDLDGGAQITGFTARFKLLVGGGSIPPADGFSFNFANDLPNDIFGEEGAGTGLTISFDTYDNGGAEAPAIDLKKGGQIISSVKGLDVLNLFHTGDYVEIYVEAHTDGSLDLNVNGTAVFSGIPSAFKASAGRFGLGARTGGSWDNHWVDDLQITTTSAPPDHPFVLSL